MAYVKNARVQDTIPFLETGIVPLDISVELSAAQVGTAGLFVPVGRFGPNTRIVLSSLWAIDTDDLDTNGTPLLTFDLLAADDIDGTGNVDVFINNSAAAQSGATDAMDASEDFTDVSLKYLFIKIEAAAATGAAGTIRIQGFTMSGLSQVFVDLTGADTQS